MKAGEMECLLLESLDWLTVTTVGWETVGKQAVGGNLGIPLLSPSDLLRQRERVGSGAPRPALPLHGALRPHRALGLEPARQDRPEAGPLRLSLQ